MSRSAGEPSATAHCLSQVESLLVSLRISITDFSCLLRVSDLLGFRQTRNTSCQSGRSGRSFPGSDYVGLLTRRRGPFIWWAGALRVLPDAARPWTQKPGIPLGCRSAVVCPKRWPNQIRPPVLMSSDPLSVTRDDAMAARSNPSHRSRHAGERYFRAIVCSPWLVQARYFWRVSPPRLQATM